MATSPMKFWCHPCDGQRATCPSCEARVRTRGSTDNNAAVWNVGYYRNARFYGIGKCCKNCWRRRAGHFRYIAQCHGRAFHMDSKYHVPPWLTFDSPVSVGQAIASESGFTIEAGDPLNGALILADWLDERDRTMEADAIRIRVHRVKLGTRLLHDPVEPELENPLEVFRA